MKIDLSAPSVALANTRITGSMLVGEARSIKTARRRVIKRFERATLEHLKEAEGRDLQAETANRTSFEMETDHRPTGTIVVRQYDYNRAITQLRSTWRVNKRDLAKR